MLHSGCDVAKVVIRYVETRKTGEAELSWKRFDFIARYVKVRQVGEIDIFGENSQFVVRKVKTQNLLPLPHWSDGGVN